MMPPLVEVGRGEVGSRGIALVGGGKPGVVARRAEAVVGRGVDV